MCGVTHNLGTQAYLSGTDPHMTRYQDTARYVCEFCVTAHCGYCGKFVRDQNMAVAHLWLNTNIYHLKTCLPGGNNHDMNGTKKVGAQTVLGYLAPSASSTVRTHLAYLAA